MTSGGDSTRSPTSRDVPVTKPSSGLPDLALVHDGVESPTAHLVVAEPFGGTEHVAPPRVFPRHLPPASIWDLARRGNAIAKILIRHFGPLALRQMRQVRHGALPAEALVRPLRETFEDLGGTFIKFGQLIASSPGVFGESVSDEFRTCLDTGPIVGFHQIRSRIEADLGMSLEDTLHGVRPGAGRACFDRCRSPGSASRRSGRRGQDPPAADPQGGGDRPGHAPATARVDCEPDRRRNGRLAARDARRVQGADRGGTRSQERSPGDDALQDPSRRSGPAGAGRAGGGAGVLEQERAHDGVPRRGSDR